MLASSPQTIINKYRSAIAAAVASGDLPRDIGLRVECKDAGLFKALTVKVIQSRVSIGLR